MNLLWIILGIILILLIFKWRSMNKPSNFAKNVAIAQLKAYKEAQLKNPDGTKEELIIAAISSWPNINKYYPESIIIDDARNESYQFCVCKIVDLEYEHRIGDFAPLDEATLMYREVNAIIPKDL
jgi:hypothetical protein